MDRLDKFRSFEKHPFLGKDFAKLKANEKKFCEQFIVDNSNLDNNAFAKKVNRLGLQGELDAIKNKTIVWGLLSQSIDVVILRRRS